MNDDAPALEAEAHLITRYLFGAAAPEALARRYVDANALGVLTPAGPPDEALVDFARRRPWSIGYLDAACGVLRPDALLRRKVLLMAAILETSPAFARRFEPSGLGRWRLLAVLGVNGMAAMARAVVGALVMQAALRWASRR